MCPELSGIYDSYYIQPIAKVNESVGCLVGQLYEFYNIIYSEGLSPGPAMVLDICNIPPIGVLPANGTIAKKVVPALQLNANELLQVRWEPIDIVEGLIWELSGQQKNATGQLHSRVDKGCRSRDPALALATFFILGYGQARLDFSLECRNPLAYAQPTARFQFWGHRFKVNPLKLDTKIATYLARMRNTVAQVPTAQELKDLLAAGDRDTIRDILGPVTLVPVVGMM